MFTKYIILFIGKLPCKIIMSSEINIKEIEVMYLMIDGKPFAKFDNFYDSESTTDTNQLTNEIKWTFALLKSYLPEGCMQISFTGMKNNEPFVLNDETEVCNISN